MMKVRSPHLLDRHNTALLVVDMQEKLIPVIENGSDIVTQAKKLIDAAEILKIPVIVSEQYPKGLGPTVQELDVTAKSNLVVDKRMFSCRECSAIDEYFAANGISSLLICGVEAHVCVMQTAFDFTSAGMKVQIVVDAVGSRSQIDRETAIDRMRMGEICVTTTEAAIFELVESSGSADFKNISKLLK